MQPGSKMNSTPPQNGKISVMHLRAAARNGGGPEKTILKTAAMIDARRFDYTVVYLRKKHHDLTPLARQYQEANLPFRELVGGVIDPFLLIRLAKLVKQNNVQILHAHDPKSIVYAFLLKLLVHNLKLVATLHGWVTLRMRSSLYAIISTALLKRFDLVIAVSKDLLEHTRKSGITKLKLLYNAIDLQQWNDSGNRPDDPQQPFRIAFVGRISQEKGPLEFVHTAQQILASSPDCEFVVAGEGPMLEQMKQEVQRSNLQDCFRFLGHLSQKEMPPLYRSVDLLLSTSHTEGMPNNLLEAMAAGVPVVATRVGGVAELITDGDNGLLASRNDIELLAKHVARLKQHPQLVETITTNARKTVAEKFCFRNRTRTLENLYAELF